MVGMVGGSSASLSIGEDILSNNMDRYRSCADRGTTPLGESKKFNFLWYEKEKGYVQGSSQLAGIKGVM
jgi:hypothetical protein